MSPLKQIVLLALLAASCGSTGCTKAQEQKAAQDATKVLDEACAVRAAEKAADAGAD